MKLNAIIFLLSSLLGSISLASTYGCNISKFWVDETKPENSPHYLESAQLHHSSTVLSEKEEKIIYNANGFQVRLKESHDVGTTLSIYSYVYQAWRSTTVPYGAFADLLDFKYGVVVFCVNEKSILTDR